MKSKYDSKKKKMKSFHQVVIPLAGFNKAMFTFPEATRTGKLYSNYIQFYISVSDIVKCTYQHLSLPMRYYRELGICKRELKSSDSPLLVE